MQEFPRNQLPPSRADIQSGNDANTIADERRVEPNVRKLIWEELTTKGLPGYMCVGSIRDKFWFGRPSRAVVGRVIRELAGVPGLTLVRDNNPETPGSLAPCYWVKRKEHV